MRKEIDNYYKFHRRYGDETIISAPPERLKGRHKRGDGKELLERGQAAWQALSQFRAERRRNIEYRNGNQWGDMVPDPDNSGKMVRESELLTRQGKQLLKHNFIQQFIRNICGQMLNSPTQTVVYARNEDEIELGTMLTETLQVCHQANQTGRLDLSLLEELILSGVGCYKVSYDYSQEREQGEGVINLVSGGRLFFDTDLTDSSLRSLSLIGELHDYSLEEVVSAFARTPDDEKVINKIYSPTNRRTINTGMESDFHIPNNPALCRVIEIWHKRGRWERYLHDYLSGEVVRNDKITDKEVDSINLRRLEECRTAGYDETLAPLIRVDDRYVHYWSVAFIAPTGEILMEMETPYHHKTHPYILTSIPTIDGTPKALIGDIIDIQRYINRLLVMIDFIMGTSAKGVLMVPENSLPDGYSIEDFSSEYVKANGVILYKPNNTRDIPFQISSNSTNVGAWEMLNVQIGLIKELSGVSTAIQGGTSSGYMAASLYAQQAENSQLNLKVLFDTLRFAQKQRDEKLLKVIMQYYRSERQLSSVGERKGVYIPNMVDNIVNFDLVVSHSVATPLYRQLNEDMLKSMFDRGQIDIEMFLSNSTLPFAEKLLSQLKS